MTDSTQTIEAYFAAMRRGPEAEADMLDLFTADALYEEPFSGSADPARGIAEIRDRLRAGWATPLPNMELDVLSVEVVGDGALSRWECRSSALPGPVRGVDRYEFREGRISALRVTIESGSDDTSA